MQYLILQHPGHNRVYYESAGPMALAELKLASRHFETANSNHTISLIEDIPYLSFETESALSDADLEILSGLSFVFALYYRESREEQPDSLIPVRKIFRPFMDEKISSMLKYPGKTNELFTRMMISVGLYSSDFAGGLAENETQGRISLLDPVAGKGTTLFEGLRHGFRVSGIEKDRKSVHEAEVFFKKYLENERWKHRHGSRRISGSGKADAIHISEFEFAREKDEFREAGNRSALAMICGDCRDTASYFRKQGFHLIVGDLPYGIAHGNKTGRTAGKKSRITGTDPGSRNPSGLLETSLAGWYRVLLPGGSITMAWNSNLLSLKKMQEIFTGAGFRVLDGVPYDQFQHRVDQSILRNIIVARKD